jgi:hypothetical protein
VRRRNKKHVCYVCGLCAPVGIYKMTQNMVIIWMVVIGRVIWS